MRDQLWRGVFPIAPTPFHPDGRIDFASLDRLIDHYAAIGADGCTILGILGEAPKLEASEALDIVRRCVGRWEAPFIVGVSAPGFAAMRALAREAMAAGAAAVMIAPPSSLRTDDQIVGYYAQAVEAIGADVPFVIQDYPLTLSVVMTPGVIRRIVQDNPSCVMLKHEDWPGLEKISALRGFERDGTMRRVAILTGNGGLFLDFEMERGADGAEYGLRVPGDADRRRAAVARGPARRGARPVRRASAAAALRAAAGRRARGAQICADAAGSSRARCAAQAGGGAERGGAGGGRVSAGAAGAEG